MLRLSGTIPIYYSGNQYNIPVEIWMPEAYPFAAPTCYVRPTQDMMIRPGHPHVDQNGLILLPYTSNWDSDHSLVELIGYQCSIFGTQPPVFRKPAGYQAQQQQYMSPSVQQYPQQYAQYGQQQYNNSAVQYQQPNINGASASFGSPSPNLYAQV